VLECCDFTTGRVATKSLLGFFNAFLHKALQQAGQLKASGGRISYTFCVSISVAIPLTADLQAACHRVGLAGDIHVKLACRTTSLTLLVITAIHMLKALECLCVANLQVLVCCCCCNCCSLTHADLQAACHRVGLAGDIPVKLAWGKAQEAAALHCLLQLFPEAAVEEVCEKKRNVYGKLH
jgi:hypothetical protein